MLRTFHGIYARTKSVIIVLIAVPVCIQTYTVKLMHLPSKPTEAAPQIFTQAATDEAMVNDQVAASRTLRRTLVLPTVRRSRVIVKADLAKAEAK